MNNAATRKKMADRYLRAVTRVHKREVGMCRKDEEYADLIAMFNQDLKNHKAVVSLIRKNKLADAFDSLWNMDTAPRDDMPETVYRWLSKNTED